MSASKRRAVESTLSCQLESMFSVPRAITVGRAAFGLTAVLRWWHRDRIPGGEVCRVAVPGAICPEVVLAILAAGCEPLFCDIDVADGLVMQSEWVRARARGASVALVVHLYGNPANMSAVRAVFPSPDCLIVDDAAQALGSRSPDGPAGALGDIGLLSFLKKKHLELGSAAILFQNQDVADTVQDVIDTLAPEPLQVRESATLALRSKLEAARALLREEGERQAHAFSGLLRGLEPILYAPALMNNSHQQTQALERYAEAAAVRVSKAALWSDQTSGSSLKKVGMTAGCVPWRYACRIPGLTWRDQHQLAQDMRATGMEVSNWYLPAHWYLGYPPGTLPGVEKLSREVFQFWVDDTVTYESILRSAAAVKQVLASHPKEGEA